MSRGASSPERYPTDRLVEQSQVQVEPDGLHKPRLLGTEQVPRPAQLEVLERNADTPTPVRYGVPAPGADARLSSSMASGHHAGSSRPGGATARPGRAAGTAAPDRSDRRGSRTSCWRSARRARTSTIMVETSTSTSPATNRRITSSEVALPHLPMPDGHPRPRGQAAARGRPSRRSSRCDCARRRPARRDRVRARLLPQ